MPEIPLTELADTIDRLVSEAQTNPDREVRTLRLVEALGHSCTMMKRLIRHLNRLADRVLNEFGFGEEQAAIALRVFVSRNDELCDFESKEALLNFLEASRSLLEEQHGLSEEKIQEIHHAVVETCEHFMDQHVGLSRMCEQFDQLERFFCRPPGDGCGGSPVLPLDGPDGRPSSGRVKRVCLYVQTFAAIGRLIISVIPFFARAGTGPTAQVQTQETRKLALLSLLLLSGFSAMLGNQEDIPEKLVTRIGQGLTTA